MQSRPVCVCQKCWRQAKESFFLFVVDTVSLACGHRKDTTTTVSCPPPTADHTSSNCMEQRLMRCRYAQQQQKQQPQQQHEYHCRSSVLVVGLDLVHVVAFSVLICLPPPPSFGLAPNTIEHAASLFSRQADNNNNNNNNNKNDEYLVGFLRPVPEWV